MSQLRLFFMRAWLRLFGPRWTVGSMAIITDDVGRICLLKHRGRACPWGLPGGLVAWPETPEDALRRELTEELRWLTTQNQGGHRVEFQLLECCSSEKFSLLEMVYSVPAPVRKEVISSWVLQSSEILEVGWFTSGEVKELKGLLERHRSLISRHM